MLALVEELRRLEPSVRRQVYQRLWYELTLVGRAVAFHSEYSDEVQLSCLTWLNEIQHRVQRAFHDPEGFAPEDLVGMIQLHIAQATELKGHVGSAFVRAIAHCEGREVI